MLVGFLHTAATNVPLFDAALRAAGPAARADHAVRPDLLATALAEGRSPALVDATASAVDDLVAAGCEVVVVTCSSLGSIADDLRLRVPVLRVDRPLAAAAVRGGARIGVVTAALSTVGPTLDLMARAAEEGGVHPEFLHAHLPEAWRLFEAGDQAGYLAAVAAEVRALAERVDVVMLAQASMAPAADLVGDVGVPVLAAPASAVAAALALGRPHTG